MKAMFLRLATLVAVLPIPLSGVAQETDELTDVVVTGYGTSIEEAKRNAFRAAVEAVVSMYVDATTHVRNGELIENEVLSYSAGLIEKSVLIGEPEKTETGIFFVKIMATVKKHQVRERLRALPVVNVQLDGESLFARMASAQDNLADAEAMIQSVLARHAACVVAEAVPGKNGHSPLDINPKTGEVSANVRVRIDMARYAQFVSDVLGKLGPMAQGKKRMRCKESERREYQANGKFFLEFPFEDTLVVVENFRTGVATGLQFNRNFMDCISRDLKTGSLAFEVVLKARDGSEVAMKEMPLDERMGEDPWNKFRVSLFAGGILLDNWRIGKDCGVGLIAPVFGAAGNVTWNIEGKVHVDIGNAGATEKTFCVPLGRFRAEELQVLPGMEIKIGHMKDGLFEEYVP